MSDKNFKRKFKFPACTKDPLVPFIPRDKRPEVMRQIRQDCINELGETLDECPLRKVCLGPDCLGRPLPTFSETAKPFIEQLSQIADIRDNKLYLKTNCNGCAIRPTCSNPCLQIADFTDRGMTREPYLIHNTYLVESLEVQLEDVEREFRGKEVNFLSIPWDCLSENRAKVIRKYLYEHKDFKRVSEEMKYNNEARAKYEFYSGLNTLSEFAVMREFIGSNKDSLTRKQYDLLEAIYLDMLEIKQVCKKFKTTKQSISNIIKRVVDKHRIRWQTFVRKQGNKVIYNTPEVLK